MAFSLGSGSVAHTCDGISGMSGSPIFVQTNDKKLVVGAVHSGWSAIKHRRSKKKLTLGRGAMVEQFVDAIPHFLAHAKIDNPDQLKEIQTELKTRRFLDDKVDGVFGRNTRFAIAAWEYSVGLPQLGLPSRLVYDVLKGVRKMPEKCDRSSWGPKKRVPSSCKTFGLDGQTSSDGH
jgi:hypothetical protein